MDEKVESYLNGSPLSFNAHLPYIKQYSRFIKRMQKLNPRVLTALVDSDNDMPKIEALRGDLPNTLIIGRVVVEGTDGKFHLKPEAKDDNREWIASPADFMNKWGRLGKRGGSLYALNEPGTEYKPEKADETARIERLVKWTCQTLQMGTLSDTALCVLNLGTGHPGLVGSEWDSIFDPILHMPPGTWDRHVLGVHEYLPMGGRILRFEALLKRCKTLGVRPPRLVITEAGWDHATGEPDGINGYKSRGINGDVYFRDLRYLVEEKYRPHIDSGVLLGVCAFSYGNSGGWDKFDVEEDEAFWAAADGWQYVPGKAAPVDVPKPDPVPEPEPVEQPEPVPTPAKYAKIVALLRQLADELEKLDADEAGA